MPHKYLSSFNLLYVPYGLGHVTMIFFLWMKKLTHGADTELLSSEMGLELHKQPIPETRLSVTVCVMRSPTDSPTPTASSPSPFTFLQYLFCRQSSFSWHRHFSWLSEHYSIMTTDQTIPSTESKS